MAEHRVPHRLLKNWGSLYTPRDGIFTIDSCPLTEKVRDGTACECVVIPHDRVGDLIEGESQAFRTSFLVQKLPSPKDKVCSCCGWVRNLHDMVFR